MKAKLFVALFFAFLLGPVWSREEAIFAGGCFWCMEKPFDDLPGVLSTTSGYTGGKKKNPSYEDVSSGGTGHYEVVRVVYDPKLVSYGELLKVFWKNVDPYDGGGQFCDRGQQYQSAIFYRTDEEKEAAMKSKDALPKAETIKTAVLPAARFYPAEKEHQDFYKTSSVKYKFYRFTCGRDKRLNELWGK